MSDAEFQGAVMAELGAIRREVAATNTTVARFEEWRLAADRRMKKLERWRESTQSAAQAKLGAELDEVEATGRQEIIRLQAELERRDEEDVQRKTDARARWLSAFGKVALLVVGSILATLAPLIARAVGF